MRADAADFWTRSKTRNLLQRPPHRRLRLARAGNLLGELRQFAQLRFPGGDVRMQPRERIAGEREPERVDEPGNVEHTQGLAEQIGLVRQGALEFAELDAEFLRRGTRLIVGDAVLGGALPE